MTQVYIKDIQTIENITLSINNTLTLYLTTFIYIFFLILIIKFIHWILNETLEIDIKDQILQNIKNINNLYIFALISINIIIYKTTLTMKFGNNIQYYDIILVSTILIITLIIIIHSYFKEINKATTIGICVTYYIISIIAYISAIYDQYIIITCNIYKSPLSISIIPIYYSCNMHNSQFVLQIHPDVIYIQQISIEESNQNKTLKEHFKSTDAFMLECEVIDNIITKQTIYDYNSQKQQHFQYKINHENHIFTHLFTKLIKI